MPGDDWRRANQDAIVAAMASNNWDEVQMHDHSALIIGDARGIRHEATNGWITLDAYYAIASETK